MTNRQSQLNQTLLQFYDRPVAKVSLELVFSAIMVIIFAVFAIRPTLITMADLSKEISDKEDLKEKMSQKIAALSSLQTQYIALQNRLGVLDTALPTSPHLQEILAILEKLASDRNLTILSLDVKDIPKETKLEPDFHKATRLSRPISISVTGSYPAIRQFVDDIRNVQQTMIVDSIIFAVSDDRGQKILKATITVNIQYLGESETK